MQGIDLHIAGQRLAEDFVVGRHVALRGAGNGEHQAFMARQQRLLNRRQDLIGVAVEARLVLGRTGVGDCLIVSVEQVIETDTSGIDIRFESCGNLARPFTGQVVNPLVIVIQPDCRQALTDGFGLTFHLHRGLGQTLSLLVADGQVAAHLFDGMKQAVELFAIGLCASGNFPDLVFDTGRQPRDVIQVLPRVLDLLDAGVEVAGQLTDLLHHLRGALLDIGHHLPDFTGCRGGARGEATNLVGHHRKTTPVLPGARRFDGGVQRQQVGLAGDGLNHQSDPLNVIAAQAQGLDQLAAVTGALTELMHARNRLDQFGSPGHATLMRLAGSAQGFATEGRGGLFGGNHHFGVADDLRRRTELRLQLVRQLLDREGHACGRQGVMTGGVGKIAG